MFLLKRKSGLGPSLFDKGSIPVVDGPVPFCCCEWLWNLCPNRVLIEEWCNTLAGLVKLSIVRNTLASFYQKRSQVLGKPLGYKTFRKGRFKRTQKTHDPWQKSLFVTFLKFWKSRFQKTNHSFFVTKRPWQISLLVKNSWKIHNCFSRFSMFIFDYDYFVPGMSQMRKIRINFETARLPRG